MAQYDNFSVEDYLVFAVMLIISASIGVYYRLTGGRQQTAKEYLLADKKMSIIPVGFSLMASFMSAITLLGVSSENYTFGTQFVVINIAYIIGTPVAAYGFLPVFYKLELTSAYEYLNQRFGLLTRLVVSSAFCLQMILYMGIVLYAPALALSSVTALPKLGSILSVGIVCTFYSTLGGMKAVLITDVFQSLLMFSAIFAVIIKGSIDVGGLEEVWRIAKEGHRLEFFNFSPDPTVRHTVWSLIIGGLFVFLSLYAVSQAQVQRLLTLRNLKKSQLSLWLHWPILTCLSLSTSFAGLVIYARYYKCDPLKEGRISSSDQLLPRFVMDSMGHLPGLPGLFVAGIFSGTLSTVSSALNSLAAVTVEDFIKPHFGERNTGNGISDDKLLLLSKMLAFGYGLLCVALTFIVENLGGVLQASLTIFGVVGGPSLGVFTLGMFVFHANQEGALTGLIISLMFSLWIGFGGPKPGLKILPLSVEECPRNLTYANVTDVTDMFNNDMDNQDSENVTSLIVEQTEDSISYFPLYKMSYLWYPALGFLITMVIGSLVSWISNSLRKTRVIVDPGLFSPLVSRWYILNEEEIREIQKRKQANHTGEDNERLEPNGNITEDSWQDVTSL